MNQQVQQQPQQPPQEPEMDFGDPALNDTEQSIMETFDDATEPNATPDSQQQQGAEDQSQQDSQTDGAQPAAEPATQQPAADARGNSDRPGADADGNLVDANGNVIAASGRERRIFERNERLTRHARDQQRHIDDITRERDQLKQLQAMPQSLGLQPADVQAAYTIMSNFKKDPVSVAKWALQETLAMGYNLNQIVGEGGNGVEMQAIAQMIDQRVGPVVQQNQQTQEQNDAQTAALRDYNNFMLNHEHADVHEDAIATLMQNDTTLTPQVAYWRLREYAARHGYDFEQPLGPQMQARQQQQQQPPAQQQVPPAQAPATTQQQQPPATPANVPPNAQQQPPMPMGAPNTEQAQTMQNVYANPDDDWDSIVAGSMRDAGIN